MNVVQGNMEGKPTADAEASEKGERAIEPRDLSEFVLKRVLSNLQERKAVFVEGSFANKPGTVILLIEKEPFEESHLNGLFSGACHGESILSNDIYSYLRCISDSKFNGIKITVIYPATEKHVKKYLYQPVYIANETPELYKNITLPTVQAEQFTLSWVYNILEHKSEADKIVFEDSDPETGFILLPDLKWDGKTRETLYLLALPMKRGILSLRDLTDKHLPLLNNIYTKGLKCIEEKYSVPSSELRVHIHYQPSFYHLHVHFTFIQYSAPGINVEKSHLLATVINNISLVPNYYQEATIPFVMRESETLFAKYEAAGIVKRRQVKCSNPENPDEVSAT